MKIIEKDFKIEHETDGFMLYFFKEKKKSKTKIEVEEDFKLQGYYTRIENALFAAYKWRIDKKNPHKEPVAEFKKSLIEYKKSLKWLDHVDELVYKSIYDLKKKVLYENK